MQERVNVKITFTVTTPDGDPFTNAVLEYSDLKYSDLVAMEKIGVAALNELNKFGEQVAAKGKGA